MMLIATTQARETLRAIWVSGMRERWNRYVTYAYPKKENATAG
jgi:hypothetical protein